MRFTSYFIYFILNHLFSTKSILPIFFRIFFHRDILHTFVGIKHACTYTRKHEHSASCISVSALTRTFACEALNMCTHTYMRSLRQRLALTSVEGIRKGSAVGRDVTTIPLGFALCESEWKPVSQLGEQARACSVREELCYEHV